MKKKFLLMFVAVLACFNALAKEPPALDGERVPFGDPFIMLHGGTYYAYGTYGRDGISVFVSDDLKTWRDPDGGPRLALHKDDTWTDRRFWAPEVYHIGGKFYMYFTGYSRVCVAMADSPLGPFVQEPRQAMLLSDEKTIDNSLFIDDDGKAYMYFDRFNDGLNIWVCELAADLVTVVPGTLTKCIAVSQEWERVWPRVNEGAFVMKHKGRYYMTYSANSYESQHYGIGLATADSPRGPWVKYEGNPIYQMVGDLVGIGHSAMFRDKKGRLKIVFHAHSDKDNIHPRAMYISDVGFKKKGGQTIMVIDPGYLAPVLVK